ncbi:hypothetical protein, conserved [Eimeria praecox]|uniref:NOL1/NOP2/Sun domain family member 4 n=1 Tax=Eimeria praecox TaxID=51316 RepID=U6H5J9_9EIME|nr:hypothetical protein, conserved [Eimeria praecox]
MSIRGGACWSNTYSKQYGQDRWKRLLNALAEVPTQLAFVAPNISHSALRYLLRKPRFVPCLIPNCFSFEDPSSNSNDKKDEGGENATLAVSDSGGQVAGDQNMNGNVTIVEDEHIAEEARAKTYFLDGASALAAYVLGARPGEVVLDMCAAPGGKSLIILSMLTQANVPPYIIGNHSMLSEINIADNDEETEGLLVCNDISRDRLARLQNTLNKFLPPYSTAGQRLQLSCADICKGGAFERFAPYDRILLDAPCSSDRHLLHKGGSALVNWSQSTPKAHAERQLKMLLIASKLLKKDGILLYSTCALSDIENDAVGTRHEQQCAWAVIYCPVLRSLKLKEKLHP